MWKLERVFLAPAPSYLQVVSKAVRLGHVTIDRDVSKPLSQARVDRSKNGTS
jgi:hypothetical protein